MKTAASRLFSLAAARLLLAYRIFGELKLGYQVDHMLSVLLECGFVLSIVVEAPRVYIVRVDLVVEVEVWR